MLTRRRWSFVGAAVGLYLGGRFLGLVQLAVLAVATVILLVGAYIWVRVKTPALTARRTLKELLQVGVEGRVDLTSLSDPDADVSLSVSFPGEVTSTNGTQVSAEIVEWKLRPGVVSTMNAQARYTDPSARSFTGAAIWLAVGSFLVAGIIGGLAYYNRDQSPRVGERRTESP